MKHADRSAYSDVEVQDLEVMLLHGKLREANRRLVRAFNQNEKLVSRLSEAREHIFIKGCRKGCRPAPGSPAPLRILAENSISAPCLGLDRLSIPS